MDVLGCLSSSSARITEAAAFTPKVRNIPLAGISPRFRQAKIHVARDIHSSTRDLGVNGITIEIPKIGEVGIFSANQSAWLSKFWRLYFFPTNHTAWFFKIVILGAIVVLHSSASQARGEAISFGKLARLCLA